MGASERPCGVSAALIELAERVTGSDGAYAALAKAGTLLAVMGDGGCGAPGETARAAAEGVASDCRAGMRQLQDTADELEALARLIESVRDNNG